MKKKTSIFKKLKTFIFINSVGTKICFHFHLNYCTSNLIPWFVINIKKKIYISGSASFPYFPVGFVSYWGFPNSLKIFLSSEINFDFNIANSSVPFGCFLIFPAPSALGTLCWLLANTSVHWHRFTSFNSLENVCRAWKRPTPRRRFF